MISIFGKSNLLLRVKVFLTDGIKLLMIQNALIPKAIGLCIKLSLEMAGQHHLYLTGILLTVVEGKELQQVHLGWI